MAKLNLSVAGVIRMIQAIGPVAAAAPAFKDIYDQLVGTFKEDDQKTLQTAYTELQSENSGGHMRLQEILRQAERDDS